MRASELRRQAKEAALAAAQASVTAHEGVVEALLSIHKGPSVSKKWMALASALPLVQPVRLSIHESKARLRHSLQSLLVANTSALGGETELTTAQSRDAADFDRESVTYREALEAWQSHCPLARQVRLGDLQAYRDALDRFCDLRRYSNVIRSARFEVPHRRLVECFLEVNAEPEIPTEVLSITATGRVSTRKMPKGRFHEIYQDCVSGCVLRAAREVFALLPVEVVLVTVKAHFLDASIGQHVERQVVSVCIPRGVLIDFDFDLLDPSDSMDHFRHRGNFKTQRRLGAFESITPFTPNDFPLEPAADAPFLQQLERVRDLRRQLTAALFRGGSVSASGLRPGMNKS